MNVYGNSQDLQIPASPVARATLTVNNRKLWGSLCRGLAVSELASIHEDASSLPGLAQWANDMALVQTVA